METRTQAYLKKKKAIEDGLPIIWIVESDTTGVEKPRGCQTLYSETPIGYRIEKLENGENKIPNTRYFLETTLFPYEVDILEGETFTKKDGYGTGFGDLWGWSYYCTFDKEDADIYYKEELERVTKIYLS